MLQSGGVSEEKERGCALATLYGWSANWNQNTRFGIWTWTASITYESGLIIVIQRCYVTTTLTSFGLLGPWGNCLRLVYCTQIAQFYFRAQTWVAHPKEVIVHYSSRPSKEDQHPDTRPSIRWWWIYEEEEIKYRDKNNSFSDWKLSSLSDER